MLLNSGDVVLSNCFALHRDYNPGAIANHMACLFERALLHYPAAPSLGLGLALGLGLGLALG